MGDAFDLGQGLPDSPKIVEYTRVGHACLRASPINRVSVSSLVSQLNPGSMFMKLYSVSTLVELDGHALRARQRHPSVCVLTASLPSERAKLDSIVD